MNDLFPYKINTYAWECRLWWGQKSMTMMMRTKCLKSRKIKYEEMNDKSQPIYFMCTRDMLSIPPSLSSSRRAIHLFSVLFVLLIPVFINLDRRDIGKKKYTKYGTIKLMVFKYNLIYKCLEKCFPFECVCMCVFGTRWYIKVVHIFWRVANVSHINFLFGSY